jgi:hypothetical protein
MREIVRADIQTGSRATTVSRTDCGMRQRHADDLTSRIESQSRIRAPLSPLGMARSVKCSSA